MTYLKKMNELDDFKKESLIGKINLVNQTFKKDELPYILSLTDNNELFIKNLDRNFPKVGFDHDELTVDFNFIKEFPTIDELPNIVEKFKLFVNDIKNLKECVNSWKNI